MSAPVGRTVGDLLDAMAGAKSRRDMLAIFAAETEHQMDGDVPDPEHVALTNMRYVAGYGTPDTCRRILGLIQQMRPS